MKKLISTILVLSTLCGNLHALAVNNGRNGIFEPEELDGGEEINYIPQNQVYALSEEMTSEEPRTEKLPYTEIIEKDIDISSEDYYENIFPMPPSDDGVMTVSTTDPAEQWKALFATQYGEAYTNPYVDMNSGQSLSGKTNRLVVRETDLALSGKNGLDFKIIRKHDNQDYGTMYSYGGNGNISVRRYIYAFKNKSTKETVYIGFYTQDQAQLHMDEPITVSTFEKVSTHTNSRFNNGNSEYYTYESIHRKLSSGADSIVLEYDSSFAPVPVTEMEDAAHLAERNLLTNSYSNLLGDWDFVMPNAAMYAYSGERTS